MLSSFRHWYVIVSSREHVMSSCTYAAPHYKLVHHTSTSWAASWMPAVMTAHSQLLDHTLERVRTLSTIILSLLQCYQLYEIVTLSRVSCSTLRALQDCLLRIDCICMQYPYFRTKPKPKPKCIERIKRSHFIYSSVFCAVRNSARMGKRQEQRQLSATLQRGDSLRTQKSAHDDDSDDKVAQKRCHIRGIT